jgi:hypothetical protein
MYFQIFTLRHSTAIARLIVLLPKRPTSIRFADDSLRRYTAIYEYAAATEYQVCPDP